MMRGLGAYGDGYEVVRGDGRYPAALEDLDTPPARLYVRGNIEVLARMCISLIGTRRPTPYGIAATELAARCAVAAGLVVVSGGAKGCDSTAGREALARGGCHVVVLGSGADVVYPSSSADLIEHTLATGGAVISQERWGTQPRRYLFPKRNLLIAALSSATFIAEASIPSGTFLTAEAAQNLGREVLAVPGSIFSPMSRGTNYLISVGAQLISAEEELECAFSRIYGTLRHEGSVHGRVPGQSARERRIMRALTATPLSIDRIAEVAEVPVRAALEIIGQLTVTGLVERQLDGRYAASASALHAQTSFCQNRGTN